MKNFLCTGMVALGIFANAQVSPSQRCGSDMLPQQFETWVQSVAPGPGKGGVNNTMSVFNIPVIVHLIHNNAPVNSITATTGDNLNAAQVQDQINILNADFNGTNPDTSLIPAAFKPLLGKFQFNFCLAVVNPTGGIMAEPGIDRIDRNTKGWTAPPYTSNYVTGTIKPQSIWDVNRYFNMWVCNLSGGLLGFATFPAPGTSGLLGLPAPYGTATTDGVVMLGKAFGSIGTAVTNAPYHKGRTTTHEVGHWLGLRHIWGDAACGTDYCNDTPTQNGANFGCPAFPKVTCANGPNGDMHMNYMDYTDDLCMYMFSHDQKYRAQVIMTNSPIRLALLSSTVCNMPNVGNDIGIAFVSSPSYSQVINCNNFINPVIRVNNYGSTTITSATFNYQVDNGASSSFSWTGSIAPTGSVNVSMPMVSGLNNGAHIYSVSVTAPNGATDANLTNNSNIQNFTIAGLFTLTAASNPTSVCAGSSATLTGTGATGYTWSPGGATGSTVNVSPTATTIYTVTASNGTCTKTNTVMVVLSTSLGISSTNATICAGSPATLTASGATTYTWNTGVTGANLVVSPAATSVYTVNGSAGTCAGAQTATVTVNSTPTVVVNSSTICSGTAATLTATGATTYSWNNGANTAAINVSPASTTVYTVTGANGTCTNAKTTTVVVNASPTVAVNSATICSGNTANLTASGATTYSWNTGATTAGISVSPVSTTVYTITGTSGSCTNVKTSTVVVNATPTVAVNSSTICSGTAATLTAAGAATYSWNTGATTAGISVSPVSTTVYTVTGANGTCTDAKTATVVVNSTPTVVVNSASICSGNSANLTASGAATYSWNTGATTAGISVSPASTTVYTITGSNGNCTNVKTSTVTVNATPTVAVNSSTICTGNAANLTASGATTYSWNTGATTSAINVSPASTTVYTVTGTSGSCTDVKTTTVVVNATPTVNVNSSTICSGNTANLTAAGATSYLWNTGAITSGISVSPAATTVYTVTGTSNGCSNVKTSTVTVNATPTVNVNSYTVCPGGSATLTATGANTYLWNTGSTANPLIVSPGSTTVYTTTGTSSGCSSSTSATVTIGTALSIVTSPASQTICSGNSATLTASGATTYTWSNGSVASSIVVAPTSNTSYNVTGASGACTGSNVASVNITLPATLALNSSSVTCFGLSNGSATVTPSGGDAPYSYNYSSGATTAAASGLSAGTYTANVTTAFGCVSSQTFVITQPSVLGLNTTVVNASCGACNGNVTYTASGGTAPYSSSFIPGSSSSNLCAGNYTVITSDGNGCSTSAAVNVNSSASSINSSAVASNASCGSCADGSAVVAVAGGTSPYTYTWMPSGGNAQNANNLLPGCYTVTINDQLGCASSATACVSFVTGIASNKNNSVFNVYPNPTSGNVTIDLGSNAVRTIEVIDVTGRLISTEKTANITVQINLSAYSNGVYYLNIKDENGTKQFKIIKH